ncbi:hypothetical protein TNCV_1636221 [Trichonephila clavipes]|uniref:Uncharacterized protein n=1 Tax=Trichonephila clavipes TaxID=2585209 RepID=A0A8X6RHK6_TRICX|nr:hypothetical protein TNCV_1636221 [Trichonephila clavipes]
MDVYKCIVPLEHESTLNSRRGASPLVRLVEEEDSRTFLTGCDVSVDCSTLSTGERLSIAHIQPYIGHHDREGDLA